MDTAYRCDVKDSVIESSKVIAVHCFKMMDVEDPVLYAAEPLIKWEQSEQGQWVMKHALEQPVWNIDRDFRDYSHRCLIRARLKCRDITYFRMKWPEQII
jgi:hypothetical protein